MSDQKEKIFCGSGWTKRFDNGGEIVNVSLNLNDLPKEFIKDGPYGKTISLKVCPKRNPVEGKPDWYVEVDQWEAKEAPVSSPASRPAPATATDVDDDELPF